MNRETLCMADIKENSFGGQTSDSHWQGGSPEEHSGCRVGVDKGFFRVAEYVQECTKSYTCSFIIQYNCVMYLL